MKIINNKFSIQDEQYKYPYHYNVSLINDIPSISRVLPWGLEYLTYVNEVINEIIKIKPKNIIDIGCGDGFLLNNLNYNCTKYGVDLSESSIKFANSFSTSATFECKDINNLNTSYNIVSLIEVMEHIPDEDIVNFIQKIETLIDNNGYLIISVPTTNIPLNKKHFRHYNCELLNKHINLHNLKLIKESWVYKKCYIVRILEKLFYNRFFSINSILIKKKLWLIHKYFGWNATEKNGQHLIRIYRKESKLK